MTLLLDTNVVSELRKIRNGRANAQVSACAAGCDTNEFFISVITIEEISMGVLSAERRDPAQGAVLRAWFDGPVLRGFAGRIVPVTTDIALRASMLQVPDRRPVMDALIAATALVHAMTIVTRNVTDFAAFGVPILNPWHPVALPRPGPPH